MDTLKFILLNVFILSSCFTYLIRAQQQGTIQNNPYWHREILDPQGRYQLEWLVDWSQERVIFNVTVATRGYVALGLARNERMEGADIVMGGVASNGSHYFSDRHAVGNETPVLDQSQDWVLHSALENSTHTFLSFSRPFDTCDEQDVSINDDTIVVLWAWGERDNVTEYHFQNRGTYFAYLRDPDLTPRSIHDANQNRTMQSSRRGSVSTQAVIGDVQRWSVREQFQIPPKRTTYWCNVRRFSPPKPGKQHIIGFNVQINPEAIENVHHMLFYRCTPPLNANPALIYEPFVGKAGQECYDLAEPLGLIPTMFCTDLVAGHAIGGRPVFFPTHTGIPIGDTKPVEYYVLQVHYDNPGGRANISADIQMDIYYTSNLRQNDATILSLGHHIPGSPSILLPPFEMNHRVYGHCSPSCTRKILPPEGIKIAGGLLHSHIAGRRIRIQHFRNGVELPWVLNDDNYKFQFQPIRIMRNEVTVLPGDQLSVQCYYDTTTADRTTVGGYATDQEMCHAFLLYYSKLEEYPACRSEIESKEYMARYLAGTLNVTWNQPSLEYMATFPIHLAGMTLSNISDSQYVNWDINLRTQLRRDHIVHPQRTICPSIAEATVSNLLGVEAPPDYVSFPEQAREYRPPQPCSSGGS